MKKVFLYITIGIALLAVPVTVYVVGQNQDTRKRAAPASTLAFSPSATSVKAGEKFTLAVKLDTAANQVGLVQLRVVFDPAYLEAEDITNDIFAPSIRVSKKIDPNGKVSISVGAKDNMYPINGSGTIAILSMKAIKASATPILVKFTPSPDTIANALNESDSDVLIGRSPASITIVSADGSATINTATITQTITASPKATLTPIPTSKTTMPLLPTLTPTITASPSAVASDSALFITSLTENEQVSTSTPQIKGKGIPGSTITIIIHSDTAQTATVTVDANGNWVYTPTTPLESGDHTVEVMTTNPDTGAIQSDTTQFIVASGNETADVSTGSAIPVSGTTSVTLILIIIGALFLLSGFALPLLLQ